MLPMTVKFSKEWEIIQTKCNTWIWIHWVSGYPSKAEKLRFYFIFFSWSIILVSQLGNFAFGSKEAALGSILYSYRHGFSGFAALLTPSQAKLISGIQFWWSFKFDHLTTLNLVMVHGIGIWGTGFPGVICVVPNKILSLHTTRSWDFLRVQPHLVNGILSKSQSGVGTIIGVLDTG